MCRMKEELNVLRTEESTLEQQVSGNQQHLDQLLRSLADAQQQIERVTA